MAEAIARNRARGTEYVFLEVGHGGYVTVETRAGSRYVARLSNIEVLVPFRNRPGAVLRG